MLLIGFGNSCIIWAQETSEDSGLEEVLSGFDDELSNNEDDVLSGFDDRTDESGSDKDSVYVDVAGIGVGVATTRQRSFLTTCHFFRSLTRRGRHF